MTIQRLPAKSFVTMPWKNGMGSTDEICLLPAGASRDAFEIRISRATISDRGVFSSFSGTDRTITLIEGEGLALEFDRHTVTLLVGQSHHFDSGLTPIGVPDSGTVRVFNVMAARDRWRHLPAEVLTHDTLLQVEPTGLTVVFAMHGSTVLTAPQTTVSLSQGDCALLDAPARLSPAVASATLVVPLIAVSAA